MAEDKGQERQDELKPETPEEVAASKDDAEEEAPKASKKADKAASADSEAAAVKAEKPKKAPRQPKEAEGEAGAGSEAEEGKEDAAGAKAARRSRGKTSKHIPIGIAHIRATFNNTFVSITDAKGEVVSWSSGGRCGFKGSRKSTAFAATTVAQEAARVAMSFGMQEVEVRVQGPGAGRESAIRALQSAGLTITAIKDCTPIPHNGCRAPKRRRV